MHVVPHCSHSTRTGALLQRCTDILERHYELYDASSETAAVCLGSAVSILKLVVASSSGDQVRAISA